MNQMTVGSLFSGIGGIDLGLERCGMRVVWQSEIDQYACKVLAKHWPDVPNLGDIKTIDWNNVERPDIIAGGYPCQPFSVAGNRAGIDDPRHLWPWFLTAIRVLRPRFALLENVPGHLSMGFDTVLADLTEIGFDAEWGIVSAASVGAPHLRKRLFVVAYPDSGRVRGGGTDAGDGREVPPQRVVGEFRGSDGVEDVAYTSSVCTREPSNETDTITGSRQARSELGGRSESRGGSDWWGVEPDVGRVAHGVPKRVDRLKCLGNAVVPQCSEFVGRMILDMAERHISP